MDGAVSCPGAVGGLSAESGANEVRLTWTPAPAKEALEDDAGVAEPEWFGVVVRQGGDTRMVRVDAPATGTVISGLRNRVEASFEVYAVTTDGSSDPAGPVSATPVTGMEGEVAGLIVAFEPGVETSQGDQQVPGESRVDSVDLSIAGNVTDDAVLVELSDSVSLAEAEQIASDLQGDPAVAWAEPDQFIFTASIEPVGPLAETVSVPNDARYATDQWNLWDQFGIGIGDGAASMTDAWAKGIGEGATVAVIDTGITAHPDLNPQLVAGFDFVSNPEQLAAARTDGGASVAFDADTENPGVFGEAGWDANPTDPGDWRGVAPMRDSTWHGTKVAGVIAAQARNGDGIAGVAPGAKIQPIRALSWRGGLLSDIAASITWASGGTVDGAPVNATPADVINLSLAAETFCPTALQQAIDGARERGSVIIAAAGNANDDAANYAPGNCNGVITVAATDRSGVRAPYSNFGERIDISAPGGNTATDGGIFTTSNTGTTNAADATWAADQGTSYAAAHVTAAAAILKARDGTLTPDAIAQQLTGSVRAFAGETCDIDSTRDCGSGILSLAQIATVASGDQDFAMSFASASSQYAVTSSTSMTSSMGGAFTVEAWVKPTTCAGAENTVISVEYSFLLTCTSTPLWRFALGTGASWSGYRDVNTGVAVQLNQWQHVAVTRSAQSANIEFYLNGQLAFTGSPWNSAMGSGQPMYVAYRPSYGSFNGQVDEVRLYSTGRAANIATDMNTYGPSDTLGLVAYYDFNEGPTDTTGTGTVYNRADGATSSTNLRTINGPTYTNVAQTTLNGTNTVVTFPRSYLSAAGGWRPPSGVSTATVLAVGGGGGGGAYVGGGGGGGGVTERSGVDVSNQDVIPVTVGGGGPGARYASGLSLNSLPGGSSSFGLVTALGGGNGATRDNQAAGNGANGGGGGGGPYSAGGTGAVSGDGARGGNNGGSGGSAGSAYGGGGGGGSDSGAVGGSYSGSLAGSGGSGFQSALTSARYGGGGGGGSPDGNATAGTGGSGGGGSGGQAANGQNGVAGLGGGGGGGGLHTGFTSTGGWGGSGVVVVSFESTPAGVCSPTTTTYTSGSTRYRVLAFKTTGSCDWDVPSGVTSINYLVVAGGGGGGNGGVGGGGGAGGMLEGQTSLDPAETLSVQVGAGGAAATSGQQSGISGDGLANALQAIGGGFGGAGAPGGSGGSGGGGIPAGLGTVGQGNDGWGGGGGAGASPVTYKNGGVGRAATLLTTETATALGVGVIDGTAVLFAGGGGQSYESGGPGSGGAGGGGNGGNSGQPGVAGVANTGGGGGGGSSGASGGAGGSGVVVLRYEITSSTACSPETYTYTTGGTPYTVVEFQGAGECSWTPPTGVTEVDVLAVGGGGGGGAWVGAGGGGGGVTTSSGVSVTPGTGVSVTVGAGGSGAIRGTSTFTNGSNGGTSSFAAASPVSALGGGVGASNVNQRAGSGADVATGGGGSYRSGGSQPNYAGGTGTGSGSSLTGGSAETDLQPHAVGGGAGAGGNGSNGSGSGSSWSSGAGGVGSLSTISGARVYYGGGGGGSAHGTWTNATTWDSSIVIAPGSGGIGGGGVGGRVVTAALNSAVVGGSGTDGLGGGGGGAANFWQDGTTYTSTGGDGGDGVVIVRYYSNWLSMSVGGAQQPSDYTYSPAVADWDTAAPKVQLIDASGTALTTSGVTVTASFTASSGSVTLTNDTATTDANGVADFSSLILDGDAGTAGTLTFEATGYASVTSSSITIEKAPLTVTAGDQTVAFGTAAATVTGAGTVTYSGFVNSETSSVVSGTVSYSTTYTSTTNAGTAGVTITPNVSGLSATNYSIAAANGTITVTKASQSALTVTSTSGTYGTAVTLTTSGGTTGGLVTYTLGGSPTASGCSISGTSLTSTSAGTCIVTATMAGSSNYNAVSSSATTVTLAKVNLTMSGVTAANKEYDGNNSATLSFAAASLNGVVSGDSSSDISFSSASATGTFTSTAVGTNIPVTVSGVTLTGTKAASSYTLTQPTGVTADIETATRTLAFATTTYSKTYGDADFTVTATPSAGTGTITYSSTGSGCSVNTNTGEVTISSVGSCQISASIATDGTYSAASTTTPVSITVNAKPLTITGMTAADKDFDDSDSATLSFTGASLVGVVGSDAVTINSSGATGTFASPNVGTNIAVTASGVGLSGAKASNYTLSAQPATTADISARALTITATSQAITYGDSTPTPAFTTSGLQGNDAIASVTFTYSGANAPNAPTASGSYSITPSAAVFSSGSASNYTFSYTPGTYDIDTASQTISFAALADKDYGDSAFSVSATSSSNLSVSFTSTTTSVCTVSGSTVTIVAAGTCTIRASQAGNGNYSAAPNVDQTFTINQASLVITASSATVDYGDPVPTITPSYSGFVYGQSAVNLSTAPTCATTYVTSSNAGSTPTTSCSGAAADNYSISYVPGSVTINQVSVSITAASFSLTYGDAVPTVTASYSGFVNGQDSTALSTLPTCSTTYTPTSNAGTTPSTSCSGAAATNYTFTYTNGSVTIAKATPTFGWSNVSKTYGDSAYAITAPTASVAGSFGYGSSAPGVISISGSTATVAGAGSATITATFTPTDATNYVSGGTVTQTVTVAKAAATVTAADQSVAYSTSASTVTGNGSVTYGLVNGDTSSVVSGTVTYTTTYTNTTDAGTLGVTITPVVTGLSAANYTFTAVPGTVTITRATQTISVVPVSSKVYGDPAFPVSGTASPSGLTVTFDSTTASVCTVSGTSVTILAAGTCTVRASQAGNVNYSAATPVDQSVSVSTRSITVTADNDTFTYGGAASPGFSVTSGALVGSDAILSASYTYAGTGSTSYPSSTTAPSNAGTYSVTPSAAVFSSGSASNYTINYVAGSVTINKANQVVAFTSSATNTDPNDTYTPSASVVSAYTGTASGLNASFDIALSSAGACTISGGVVTFVTRNSSCVIEATAPGDANFNAQTTAVTQTIVIGALNQTITFTRPANVAFGSSSQQMAATASSGLTVTYTVDTSQAACDVAATGVVTIKAVGACTVTALQAGDSQYAAASSVTQTFQVVAALPTAPTLTYVSPSSQSITAGFTAPGFTGGVSITGYSLVARVGGVAVASTTCASSPCTITGLVNGTNYTVTVAAINSAGTGPASTPSGTITPYTSAFAVSGLTPTPGDTVMDLTWTPLTNAQLGGGSFTRYEVSYRNPAVTSTWTLATNALTTQATSSYQVTGLTNGISYDFQVVAITTANATEVPGNTAQVVQYPSTVPSSPRTLSVLPVAGSSSLTDVQFSWSAPLSDGGAPLGLDALGNAIPSYLVTVTGSAGAAIVTCTPPSNTATYCTATGLTNGASYTFSVVATNRMGDSPVAADIYNVPSADATLSALVVSGTSGAVELTPAFASGTNTYTATVVNAVASVTVTPTTTAAGASVSVDGTAVTSGTPSTSIPLAVGSNVISVLVTAADPNFTETYTVTITRAAAPVVPSGGGGGGVSPGIPVTPPAAVMNGGSIAGVLLNGESETDVLWRRNGSDSGWSATSQEFSLTVATEASNGSPQKLAANGEMQVPQGGFVVVNGDGYQPDTEIAAFAIPRSEVRSVGRLAARSVSGAIAIGSASVGSSGAVGATFAIPVSMDVGQYVLQVNGVTTSLMLRSVNLQLAVVPAEVTAQTGELRQAAFYKGGSATLSKAGRSKVTSLASAVPKGAQNVRVSVVGVATSAGTPIENLDLARDRAQVLVDQLVAAGVKGDYTVSVSTDFAIRSADKGEIASYSLEQPARSSSGKPLTTVTITYTVPAGVVT